MMPTVLWAAVRACPGRGWDEEHCCCMVSSPVACVAAGLEQDECPIDQWVCRCLGLHADSGLGALALLQIHIGSVEVERADFADGQQQWRLGTHEEHRSLRCLFELLLSGPLEQELPLVAWTSTLAQHEEPSPR